MRSRSENEGKHSVLGIYVGGMRYDYDRGRFWSEGTCAKAHFIRMRDIKSAVLTTRQKRMILLYVPSRFYPLLKVRFTHYVPPLQRN